MRGLRRWLTSGALLAGTAGVQAQLPAPLPAPEPDPAAGLPGGTVVSGKKSAGKAAVPPAPATAPKPVPTPAPVTEPALPGGSLVTAGASKVVVPAPASPAPAALPAAPAVEPALPAGQVVGSGRPGTLAPGLMPTIPPAPVQATGGQSKDPAMPSRDAAKDVPAPPSLPTPPAPPKDVPAPPKDAPAPPKEMPAPKEATPPKDGATPGGTPPAAGDVPPPPVLDAMKNTGPFGISGPIGPKFVTPGGHAPFVSDCCGPVGAHGPIGEEIYLRTGPSFPRGNGLLASNLSSQGWTVQGGGRSQFFDAGGDAAWAIDLHLTYTFNEAKGRDIFTFRGDPVTLRDMHRTAVGLGLGRDYFLFRPGFVLDTWDMNFRLGWDVGGRWGAGHVNLDPTLEENGYRRHYDVFGQAFAGLMATVEIPIGGWTYLIGGRVEADYTWSDLLPRESNFYEGLAMFTVGVRY